MAHLRRNAKLRSRYGDNSGDILPGEIVRAVWGGPIGFVESIAPETSTAIVFWHTSRGYREIVAFAQLRRASANPAFGPDVREV